MKKKYLVSILQTVLIAGTLFAQPTSSVVSHSYAGGTFFIKSRSTQKYLVVLGASNIPGANVLLGGFNAKKEQKFTFQDAGDGFYFIRTNSAGLYLTLLQNIAVGESGATGSGLSYQLIQQNLYTASPQDGAVSWPKSGSQKWKILSSSDTTCVLITNKNLATNVIATNPTNGITYTPQSTATTQHWLLKPASLKENPDTLMARRGLVNECIYVPRAYGFSGDPFNLARTLPQWRPVGDNNIPTRAGYRPANVCETVEGRVTNATVAFEDNPINHYTHDFVFDVIPDPYFNYILSKKGNRIQETIHVEWESGIAQGDHKTINLAAEPNRRGESCGFYSKGHQRQDIIWNWPSLNDWVHVEGQWVFDLAHEIKTEIHPPRFVAIQRNLPEKYSTGGNFYFATRCDLYASGDGNALTNNRGLESFVQRVKMSEKNYKVTFRHNIPRPNQNAQLRIAFINQKGDDFVSDVWVKINGSGTADIPEPNVEITLPWFSQNVSNTSVFARTMLIYWDDAPSQGASTAYRNNLRTFQVTLDNVTILKNIEEGDLDAGEARMFANIGGKWIFLNEFCGVTDILSEGLGNAIDQNTLQKKFGGALPSNNYKEKFQFTFNQSFEVYLPADRSIRCYVTGWEEDYFGGHMGELMNPYLTCDQARVFINRNADWRAAYKQNKFDDALGFAETFINSNSLDSTIPLTSRGVNGDDVGTGAAGIFKTQFRIRRW